MRTLLATILLVPLLALAQTESDPDTTAPELPPPTSGPQPATPGPKSPSPFGRPRERFNRPPRPAVPRPGEAVGEEPAPRRRPTFTPDQPGGRPATPTPPAPSTSNGPAEATIKPVDGRCVPLQGRFMLSFNKADIVDVLEQASRWTCRNFIYTDDVARGKITLLSKTPVTSEEAYAAFLAALAANNITIYSTGKYYKLGRSPDSKKLPIPTYTDSQAGVPATEQIMTKVIRLQSTDADMLRGVLGNFISPQGADIQSIPPDTLIITDTGLNIRRIEKMLETIDRPGGGDLIHIVQLRYAAAKDIADKLNQIFQAQGSGRARRGAGAVARTQPPGQPPQPGVPMGVVPGNTADVSVSKVLPDDRTNKLIIIADDKSFERIQQLLEQLDVPTGGDGGIHVVFLKNASAEDMATTLSNLASGQAKKSGTGAPPGVYVPPGAPGMPRMPGMPGQPGAEGSATAELFSGDVKITADKAQNALLVQASGADFAAIARLIEKLDRPRRQVFVEAVIMEVTIGNDFKFGVGAHGFVDVKVNGKKGVLPLVSQPDPNLSSLSVKNIASLGGFLTGFSGPTSGVLKDLTGLELPSIGVLVQALQSSNDVNVIATPTILATDNQDAEITVNDKIPYQSGIISPSVSNLLGSTSSSTTDSAVGSLLGSGGLSGLTSQIQHEDVQLRLKMKPQINEGGNVRLTLELEKDDQGAVDPTLGPSFLKRTVKSDIVAKDQATIVIGGLLQETESRGVQKVPVLGSLPVLGGLFRSTQTTKKKTNLLVFLTPYIIRDEADYRRIFEKKRRELEEFQAQFYGRKRGYQVDIDYSRKASPLTRIHQGVTEETLRIENGGPGLPGEGVSTPPGRQPPAAPGGASNPPAIPAPVLEPEPGGAVSPSGPMGPGGTSGPDDSPGE